MCILLLSLQQHPKYPLIVAANRDEFYDRPTNAADFWADAPHVLAGRDRRQGGTWLGITRQGRFAALTNFRDAESTPAERPSRGHLVSKFLLGDEPPHVYLSTVAQQADRYNGFSLIAGQGDDFIFYSNREGRVRRLAPGVYGLSNHLLNTPWPKVSRGTQSLSELLFAGGDPAPEILFATLADGTIADDAGLPDTGIGLARERLLSPLFISGDRYGTRSSTVILLDQDGNITFSERSFDGSADRYSSVTHSFRIGGG
ncbi:MAG: NRDE family protein [Gammaproteobacteria bacterium]|nr:MAG: NRDE family protein [Gammaproteobacteria bacterium]